MTELATDMNMSQLFVTENWDLARQVVDAHPQFIDQKYSLEAEFKVSSQISRLFWISLRCR